MESNKDKLSKIPEVRAQRILETYDGFNNYILSIKKKLENQKHFKLTRAQADYINSYNEVTPKLARKWVDLDSYFGTKMMEEKLLTKIPEKVYVEKILVEKDKSFHIWGKLFESEKLHDFWLPKVALIPTQKVKNVEIDYKKYSHRPPLSHQKEAIEKPAPPVLLDILDEQDPIVDHYPREHDHTEEDRRAERSVGQVERRAHPDQREWDREDDDDGVDQALVLDRHHDEDQEDREEGDYGELPVVLLHRLLLPAEDDPVAIG